MARGDFQAALLAASGDICGGVYDAQGYFQDGSAAYGDLVDLGGETGAGKRGFLTTIAGVDRAAAEVAWAHAARGNIWQGVLARQGRGGRVVFVQSRLVARRDTSGAIDGVIDTAMDVSEHHLEALQDREIISELTKSQAMARFAPDSTILNANEGFLAAMGAPDLRSIAGRKHRIFVPREAEDSPQYVQFWDDLRAGTFQQGEFLRKGLDGREVWISATYLPVHDARGEVAEVVKFAVDVTERRIAMDRLAACLFELANGNTRVRLGDEVAGDYEEMRTGFNHALDGLEALIRSVMGSTEWLGETVASFGDDAQKLSVRAKEQAASLVETSDAMRAISKQVDETAQAAGEVDRQARDAQGTAEKGREIMIDTVEAIKRIKDAMQEVAEITKVIEGFAFQTNLLSINAAVEAARAGDAGKGFSVVAKEVRHLAQRSAEASKTIADLTRRCEKDVKAGSKLAETADAALKDIETSVGTVVSAIVGVAKATRQQSTGISEVESTIKTMESSLQSLSGLSSDGFQNTNKISQQVMRLQEIVSHFSTRLIPEVPLDRSAVERRGFESREKRPASARNSGSFAA